jgi:hypothetical protein
MRYEVDLRDRNGQNKGWCFCGISMDLEDKLMTIGLCKSNAFNQKGEHHKTACALRHGTWKKQSPPGLQLQAYEARKIKRFGLWQ